MSSSVTEGGSGVTVTAGTTVGADDGRLAEAAGPAEALAADAAAEHGVQVRTLDDPSEHRVAAAVLQRIWSYPEGVPMPPEMLRAFAYTGNYVGAAYDGAQMVGVATAFRTNHNALHSHIAGVLPSHQGRSIGYVLKLHQRAWALRRGIGHIGWTFDPLIRRNAHFNLIKLGAGVADYLADFYGGMTDRINAGDHSDRLLVEWDLLGPVPGAPVEPGPGAVAVLRVGPDGGPVVQRGSDTDRVLMLPPDAEALRDADPVLSSRWRAALRSVLTDALSDGHRIVGLDVGSAYVTRKELP